jgi:hypothetical protein
MARSKWSKKSLERYLKEDPQNASIDVLVDVICDLYFTIKSGIKNEEKVEGYIRELHILLDDLLATPKASSSIRGKTITEIDDKLSKELERVLGDDSA